MKREVIGFSAMTHTLLEQHFSQSPFFFASQQGTMLAVGVEAMMEQVIPFAALADHAQTMLKKAQTSQEDNPILFAAIPFHDDVPSRFFIPKHLYISASVHSQKVDVTPHVGNVAKVTSPPSGERYKQGVSELIHRFEKKELDKAVLSRTLTVETEQPVDQLALLRNLLAMNPLGYTFSIDIGDGQRLMGASPELLVSKKGHHVTSNPLAGSRAKTNDEKMNAQAGHAMLDSHKDLNEHALVVEEVARVLSKHCRNLYTPMVPSVIETETMLHLSSVLEGQCIHPELNVLRIAAELHPTPAVCGFPKQVAYEAIQHLEHFQRGYFTGMVGWCDARGNGEWVVTIRCGKVSDYQLQVFAGAGIVTHSNPQSELEETGAKMSTFLKAAGIKLDHQLTA